jgi:hypothetical protein
LLQLLPDAVIGAVALVGVASVVVARLPAFRDDMRRSIALAVAGVSLLTLVLSLEVLMAASYLQASAEPSPVDPENLLLAGLVLTLTSSLSLFFSLGVLIWTMGAPQAAALEARAADASDPSEIRLERFYP